MLKPWERRETGTERLARHTAAASAGHCSGADERGPLAAIPPHRDGHAHGYDLQNRVDASERFLVSASDDKTARFGTYRPGNCSRSCGLGKGGE